MANRKYEGTSTLFSDDDGTVFLTIDAALDRDRRSVELNVDGELRSEIVPDFQDELEKFTLLNYDLVLNFDNVTYITSSVIEALLKIQRMIDSTRSGRLTLRCVHDSIYSEMDAMGVAELLRIEV